MPALHFKLLVGTMFGIVVDETRFAFQGRDLEDDKTVGDYGLEELSNVEVLGRLRGGMPPRRAVPRGALRQAATTSFKAHFSGFMHLTNPILDTLNNVLWHQLRHQEGNEARAGDEAPDPHRTTCSTTPRSPDRLG
jgi:hypothetical protein